MKKLFTTILAAGTLVACGTKPEATVEGTVNGVADSTQVYLLANDAARLDSTLVVGGKFRFEIAKAYPDQMAIAIGDARMPFFVEPGTITADIDMEADPREVKFSGTPTNDAAAAFEEQMKSYNDRMMEVLPAVREAQGTPAFDSLYAIYEGISKESDKAAADYVVANPASLLSASIVGRNAYTLTTPEMVDSVLTVIAAAPANGFTDRLVQRRDILATTAVGATAPDFSQAQPDGTELSLSSLRGKLLLVDFWASWCGPCRAENPNVVALYNDYKDKGFDILGVSLDNVRENWLQAIEQDGLVWHHVSDVKGWKNAVAEQYGVKSIPHTVLVGADGVIVAKNLRGAELRAKVAEILDGAVVAEQPAAE